MQQRRAGPRGRQTAPFRLSRSDWKVGSRGDGNLRRPCCRSRFTSQICKGQRFSAKTRGRGGTEAGCAPGEDAAGRGKHQPAGKRTTNTYACNRCQAEMNKDGKSKNNHVHLYARRGNSFKKNGTLQSILLPLVSYRI